AMSKHIVMEVMMGKKENLAQIEKAGIPMQNIVGFVSHDLPVKSDIFDMLHAKGVMGMQGSHRNYERQFNAKQMNAEELAENYRGFVGEGVDIIEADLGIRAGQALQSLNKDSSKARFFQ